MHDMRNLLGIMRNTRILINEEEEESEDNKTLQTNLNDQDKESILESINSIKTYRIFVNNINMDDNKIIINGTYTHDNYDYSIYMIFDSGNRDSSTLDIQLPEQSKRVLDANNQTTIYGFCDQVYNLFANELFDKCSSILQN